MRKYTVDDIMALRPCENYPRPHVAELWDDRESLTAREIAELEIPVDDRIWALCWLASPRIARLFACDCAERALRRVVEIGGSTDPRSWYAIVIARLYAEGHRPLADLESARSAAWTAARSADADVEDAAEAAAWVAVRSATRAAVWSTNAAAWVAARAATRAATRSTTEFEGELRSQLAHLVEMMEADDA